MSAGLNRNPGLVFAKYMAIPRTTTVTDTSTNIIVATIANLSKGSESRANNVPAAIPSRTTKTAPIAAKGLRIGPIPLNPF